MSPETQPTNPDLITVPEGLLTERSETQPETSNVKTITVPEGLIPDADERGIEAGKLHESVSTDLAQKAIAEARIREGQDALAIASAEAVSAAENSRVNANIE